VRIDSTATNVSEGSAGGDNPPPHRTSIRTRTDSCRDLRAYRSPQTSSAERSIRKSTHPQLLRMRSTKWRWFESSEKGGLRRRCVSALRATSEKRTCRHRSQPCRSQLPRAIINLVAVSTIGRMVRDMPAARRRDPAPVRRRGLVNRRVHTLAGMSDESGLLETFERRDGRRPRPPPGPNQVGEARAGVRAHQQQGF
jgi:hypothetical protein